MLTTLGGGVASPSFAALFVTMAGAFCSKDVSSCNELGSMQPDVVQPSATF